MVERESEAEREIERERVTDRNLAEKCMMSSNDHLKG